MTQQPLGSDGLVEAVARLIARHVYPRLAELDDPASFVKPCDYAPGTYLGDAAREIGALYAARIKAAEARAQKLEARLAEAEAEYLAEADSLRDRTIERTVRAQSAEAQLAQALAREGRLREALTETRRLVSEASMSGFVDEAAVTALFINNGAITRALSEPPVKPEGQTDPSVARAEVAASSGVKSDNHNPSEGEDR